MLCMDAMESFSLLVSWGRGVMWCTYWGNVSAPGACRASFWTRAPPVAF